MNSRSFFALMVVLVVSACSKTGPTFSVSNTTVIAAAPGQVTSVAYLAIENHGGKPATMTHISSPQFARAEMHETVLENGVAHMRALGPQMLGPGSILEFKAGGKHVMLFSPVNALAPGDPVALHIHFASEEFLIVETTLKKRHSPG